jgi:hypothetical protein
MRGSEDADAEAEASLPVGCPLVAPVFEPQAARESAPISKTVATRYRPGIQLLKVATV